jgi:hypothetical protein
MPEIVKIGRTTRTAEIRARELSRPTGVPVEFEVIYDELVSDVEAAETLVHERLSDRRVNKDKEFFRVGIRDAIRIVQEVGQCYPVDEESDATEIDILPQLEDRMRRWLRREIVSVKFVQFPDLCLLRVTEQPDLTKIDAFQTAIDLRVFGNDDDDCDVDAIPYDPLLFSPTRRTIKENVAILLELDPRSMAMTGLRLLTDEAAEYADFLWKSQGVYPPLRPPWKVMSIDYEMWGSHDDDDNQAILNWFYENDLQRPPDHRG